MLLAAGAVEGALLGAGQALALRFLDLPRACCGRGRRSSPVVWTAAGILGLILLATIPTAQILLLRRVVRRPWRWLPANAIG